MFACTHYILCFLDCHPPFQHHILCLTRGRDTIGRMSCNVTSLLPLLQSYRRGERLSLAIDYCNQLGEGETIATAVTTIERLPAAASELDSIVGTTAIDGSRTIIPITIAADQPFGRYALRQTMTTSSNNKWVVDHTLSIMS